MSAKTNTKAEETANKRNENRAKTLKGETAFNEETAGGLSKTLSIFNLGVEELKNKVFTIQYRKKLSETTKYDSTNKKNKAINSAKLDDTTTDIEVKKLIPFEYINMSNPAERFIITVAQITNLKMTKGAVGDLFITNKKLSLPILLKFETVEEVKSEDGQHLIYPVSYYKAFQEKLKAEKIKHEEINKDEENPATFDYSAIMYGDNQFLDALIGTPLMDYINVKSCKKDVIVKPTF